MQHIEYVAPGDKRQVLLDLINTVEVRALRSSPGVLPGVMVATRSFLWQVFPLTSAGIMESGCKGIHCQGVFGGTCIAHGGAAGACGPWYYGGFDLDSEWCSACARPEAGVLQTKH